MLMLPYARLYKNSKAQNQILVELKIKKTHKTVLFIHWSHVLCLIG